MTIPPDPAALRALDDLMGVERQLGEAAGLVIDARSRSRGLADQTNWRTDAATAFHTSADDLRRGVAHLVGELDFARGEVRRARSTLEMQAWGHGG